MGAPAAVECADRWHLYNNLCEAVDKTIRAHRADLRGPVPDTGAGERSVPVVELKQTPIVDRTRRRHAEIHELLGQGYNQTQICQILGLSFGTVQKFRRAATADELLIGSKEQPRHFRSFIPYLRKRVLKDGCGNAAQLCRELRDQGYRGSVRTIRHYVEPLRTGLVTPELPPKPPSVRDVRRWITSDPDHLTDDDKDQLATILDRSQPLATLDRHVTAFAKASATWKVGSPPSTRTPTTSPTCALSRAACAATTQPSSTG